MIRSAWASKGAAVVSAVVLTLVVAGGTVAALAGGGGGPRGRVVTVARVVRGTSSSGCSLPAGSQDVAAIQMSPPAVTGWLQVGNVEVPQAPATYGPQHTTADGWPYCFADDPAGAVLFAASVWAAGTAHTSTELLEHYAVDVPATALGSSSLAGYPLAFAGYQILSYSPARAVVQVVLSVSDKGDVQETTTLLWQAAARDWRLYVPPSGGVASSVVDPSLEGSAYVGWSMP